jgi:type IV pilus assembly protein PilA
MNKQKGFSLVELMVVIAIIGILATIAIPSYKLYLAKSRVAEAINITSMLKIKIMDYYNQNGSLPNESFGDVSNPSPYINVLHWSIGRPAIEVWLQNIPYITSTAPILWLSPSIQNGAISWTCQSHSDPYYQLPCKILPGTCQNANCSN